ncbi:hypothetical protein MHM84_03840 [Halomonas sp. McH1-25]|uniref:hypothetical protein n=1 Tax=unclassified Halomonas TaxID=2609666 RepID=UPI001EF4FBC3|nr:MULTISPECIES: hypothetical protein [unclassified Halomonas]MCG7598905.1 hypothetical protein [Halomonas sp. McH1-25]MCP1340868.1 hypothetical protein [Halomonas sp. FL8]MCP1361249.1 hypothetical protein [Halomonas sp. BBD45]MCP1366197.1 hypothetical protein [Halomonas sp. BBD48]
MVRIVLLGALCTGALVLFMGLNSSPPKGQADPMADWDMRQEMQKASDIEHNRWKREMVVEISL